MKKIIIFIMLVSAPIFAQLTQKEQERVSQSYQNVVFAHNVSIITYACPSISEVQNALKVLSPNDDNYFQDNHHLVWSIQLPTNKPQTLELTGFYDAEYEPNRHAIVCSYPLAKSNEGVGLMGYFWVEKPVNLPWIAFKYGQACAWTSPDKCSFHLLKMNMP